MSADCSIVTSFSLSPDGVAIVKDALDKLEDSTSADTVGDKYRNDVKTVWRLFWAIQPNCSLYASVIKELPPKKESDNDGG